MILLVVDAGTADLGLNGESRQPFSLLVSPLEALDEQAEDPVNSNNRQCRANSGSSTAAF